MSRRCAYGLAAVLGLLAGALACEDEEPQESSLTPGEQFCQEVTTRLRGCGLLSEGEPNCGLFRSPEYTECVRPCTDAASCEDFRAQACDDVSNALGLCIDRCLLEVRTIECGDGTSIAVSAVCDGERDCANGFDEQSCNETVSTFDCGNGERVASAEQCDGTEDCSNGRDEAGCPMQAMTLCPGGEF